MSAAYQDYLASAQNGLPWWRAVLAFLALVAIWLVGTTLVIVVISILGMLTAGDISNTVMAARINALMMGGVTGWVGGIASMLLLMSIAFFWPATWVAQLIMSSGLGSVLSIFGRLRWSIIGRATVACVLVYVLVLALSLLWEGERYALTDHVGSYLLYIPLLLFAIALQASGEELVFRGWLVQQSGRVWVHPLFTFGITTVLFALLHGLNQEVLALGPVAFLLFVAISVPLAYAVWRTGGLEIAFAYHTVNNLFATMIFYPDTDQVTSLSGFALMTYAGDPYPNTLYLWGYVAVSLISGALILTLLFWHRSPLAIRET